jgi:hypothetical protein
MQSQVLFPLHEDLIPDPTRSEPSVWIRRLYILDEPNVHSLIREVPFERGLNIIRTEALPSFQYIVTTTKAPPSYCIDGGRHTYLILHGRDDEGRLLKRTF